MTVWMFPGQASQSKGMGAALFEQFPDEMAQADAQLGYSIRDLCLNDSQGLLGRTDYTQPALYVVCALAAKARRLAGEVPDFLVGHSLGEYAALFAAGAFDFVTGVKLVQQRGRLMAAARNGGMLAVVGMELPDIQALLQRHGFKQIDLANLNSPVQTVLSGDKAEIDACARVCLDAGITVVALNVSAAFHSRLMVEAAFDFGQFLQGFEFATMRIPVISNVSARPYERGDPTQVLRRALSRQVAAPVLWQQTIQYLLHQGQREFIEVGPGNVLTRLMKSIQAAPMPAFEPEPAVADVARPAVARASESAQKLGAASFRQRYGLDCAYLTGAMYRGIASAALVQAMAKAGCMGFLGTGGMSADWTAQQIAAIKRQLGGRRNWGCNLISQPDHPHYEMALARLYVQEDVPVVEASAFVNLSEALVHYRYAGARRAVDGSLKGVRPIILKASRPEVLRVFLGPPPQEMLERMVEQGLLSQEEAFVAQLLPMLDDVSAEGDSGGHTDQACAFTLIPAFVQIRDEQSHRYPGRRIHVGAAGGIGTPAAIVAALSLGADFVMTGSINQATVESGMSDGVKDMLAELDVHDFAYAPAGDMFELGARAQVVRKGSFFAARANRLFDLYRSVDSLEDLPEQVRAQIEERFFGRRLDEVWRDAELSLRDSDPDLLRRAQSSPKIRMALVFRWYFRYSADLALRGDPDGKVNYQVHSGPALGAFNQWARVNGLSAWQDRHVDDIALRLLDQAAVRFNTFFGTA